MQNFKGCFNEVDEVAEQSESGGAFIMDEANKNLSIIYTLYYSFMIFV